MTSPSPNNEQALNDLPPNVRAAFVEAMARHRLERVEAVKLGKEPPPTPKLSDFITVNGSGAPVEPPAPNQPLETPMPSVATNGSRGPDAGTDDSENQTFSQYLDNEGAIAIARRWGSQPLDAQFFDTIAEKVGREPADAAQLRDAIDKLRQDPTAQRLIQALDELDDLDAQICNFFDNELAAPVSAVDRIPLLIAHLLDICEVDEPTPEDRDGAERVINSLLVHVYKYAPSWIPTGAAALVRFGVKMGWPAKILSSGVIPNPKFDPSRIWARWDSHDGEYVHDAGEGDSGRKKVEGKWILGKQLHPLDNVIVGPWAAREKAPVLAELEAKVAQAGTTSDDPDLAAMNQDHAILPIGGQTCKTRVVTWGDDHDFPGRKMIIRAQSFSDFRDLHSNRRKTVIAADGTTKKVPIGAWWLNQPGRRQYTGGQRFMPQHDAAVVGDTLNLFEGFSVQPRKPEGKSGEAGCKLFLDHGLKVMCSGSGADWDYLLKREAWIIQNRRRSEIAAGFQTQAEGSGKGFWCNHLGYLYGRHYMQLGRADHVIGKFNAHLETLLKLSGDEALFVGDPRHRNALFGLITEPSITIEPKNIGAYNVPNFLNIDLLSNSAHFIPVGPTARRFFAPTVSEDRVGDFDYFNTIEAQLKDGGYEALLYHLKYEVDLRDFDVRKVPKTGALAQQAAYSRRGLDGLVEKVCSEGVAPCDYGLWPDFSITADGFGGEHKKGFDTFVDTHPDPELRRLGALRVKNLLRKEWNCITGRDARRGASQTSGVQWPPLAALRAMFEERHGPQEWLHPNVDGWPEPKKEHGPR